MKKFALAAVIVSLGVLQICDASAQVRKAAPALSNSRYVFYGLFPETREWNFDRVQNALHRYFGYGQQRATLLFRVGPKFDHVVLAVAREEVREFEEYLRENPSMGGVRIRPDTKFLLDVRVEAEDGRVVNVPCQRLRANNLENVFRTDKAFAARVRFDDYFGLIQGTIRNVWERQGRLGRYEYMLQNGSESDIDYKWTVLIPVDRDSFVDGDISKSAFASPSNPMAFKFRGATEGYVTFPRNPGTPD
ncbi:MAG: hypothetical protein V1798_08465 [Pseudomonadota bacterium]